MAFKVSDLFEAPEEEVARLAAAPEGSISHSLARLPVNILGYLRDQIIQLPWRDARVHGENYHVAVVPITAHKERRDPEERPWRLHTGYWDCVIVASDHPKYPVGGHRICVGTDELVRGKLVEIPLQDF